ncbi:Hypothetical protein POVR2_LOCUS310 [uncultured virus]|nr:Hypothetical protein POVR2_LOCUS310 [uncultured virus]
MPIMISKKIAIIMTGRMLASVESSIAFLAKETDRMLAADLVICLVIFLLILFVLFYFCERTFWSSLAGACFVALIVLVVCYPPLLLISEKASWKTILYCVLIFIFLFIIFMYILTSIIKDRRRCRTECNADYDECSTEATGTKCE